MKMLFQKECQFKQKPLKQKNKTKKKNSKKALLTNQKKKIKDFTTYQFQEL